MQCELCSSAVQGGGTTRCTRCGFDATLPPDVKSFLISLIGFRPGELLEGRYRIDRILGYGGMSVVYKAHDDVLGEDVAIKVINRGRMGDDNKLITDIRRDIVTTRKLAHPDIVKIYDFHKTDACGFLTMEFVPGKDVSSLIAERGRLDEAEVCRIAAQVAEALQYAHANGVIHCDIKPANLLLAENGRVKIADFGISRVMHEESSGLTGLVVGTPAYMAPEQIRGERPGPRTDMYALGIVMWHCLMGSPPYTRGDISYQHVHEPLPPLNGVSPALERIIRRAASKAIGDRYPAMTDMVRELNEVLQERERTLAATLIQGAPAGMAATVVQTSPPPLAGTVLQAATPGPAGTVAQTRPPARDGASAQIPLQQAGTVAQAPPRPPASVPPRPPGTATPTGTGGGPPPAGGGAAGAKEQPSPASGPASSKLRAATIAAGVLLLGAAAAWGLFFRSPESARTDRLQLASSGGLPPVQSPPPGVVPAPPPPERPSPGAAPSPPPRQVAVGSGVVTGAVGVAAIAAAGARTDVPPAMPSPAADRVIATPSSTPPPPAVVAIRPAPSAPPPLVVVEPGQRGAEPPPVPPPPVKTYVPVPPPVSARTPLPTPIQPPPSVQPPAPPPPAAAAPPPTPPLPAAGIKESSVAPVRTEPPEPVPTVKPASREPEQAAPQPSPPARALDLTPIQITALPRGRWCDIRVRAVGTGLPMASARSEVERRLSAERSAELDAYRRIAENVKGTQVSGGSTVKDFVTADASYRTKVDAVIKGARRVDSQKNTDGTWSIVMELNLSGMCDVIQAGTP